MPWEAAECCSCAKPPPAPQGPGRVLNVGRFGVVDTARRRPTNLLQRPPQDRPPAEETPLATLRVRLGLSTGVIRWTHLSDPYVFVFVLHVRVVAALACDTRGPARSACAAILQPHTRPLLLGLPALADVEARGPRRLEASLLVLLLAPSILNPRLSILDVRFHAIVDLPTTHALLITFAHIPSISMHPYPGLRRDRRRHARAPT